MRLIEHASEANGIDLEKLSREYDPRILIEREQGAGIAFGVMHRAYLLDRAPEQVQKILAKMRRGSALGLLASKQGFVSSDYTDFPGASLRAAINTTTTETNLWDPGIHAPLPVGEIRAGRSWRCVFGGVAGTTSTPTIAFTSRIGTNNSAPPTGTTLGIGPTMTCGTFTAQPWYGEGNWGCRIKGVAASGGTMTGVGFVVMPGAAAATTTPICVFGGGIAATIDDTIAQAIGVSVTWGSNSASNTITPQQLMFCSLN